MEIAKHANAPTYFPPRERTHTDTYTHAYFFDFQRYALRGYDRTRGWFVTNWFLTLCHERVDFSFRMSCNYRSTLLCSYRLGRHLIKSNVTNTWELQIFLQIENALERNFVKWFRNEKIAWVKTCSLIFLEAPSSISTYSFVAPRD